MNYKEVRKIRAGKLRNLCIEKNWYTRGTNEEYGNLLFTLAGKDNLTTDDIVNIVNDIMLHSEIDGETFETIAYEVLRIADEWIETEE